MKNKGGNEKVKFDRLKIDEIAVHVAESQLEKREVYRFRYQVFVEEMKKSIKIAEQNAGMLIDPMDDQSLLLYAHNDTGIVGTLRLTFGNAGQFPQELAEIFCMEQFQMLGGDTDKKLCLTTKLAIKEGFRGSQVLYMLMSKAYELARTSRTKFAYGGCNPHLVALNEQMGFRRFARNFTDPGYGLLIPLVMVVEDLEHLRAVRSPFYRIARKLPHESQCGQEFLRAFPQAAKYINSQLISKADLWTIITQKLGQSPLSAMPLLEGLSQDESAAFLHCGVILPCFANDRIVHHGEMSDEIFFLLSGSLLSQNSGFSRLIQPGQSFGGAGLIRPRPQHELIRAVVDSEVLVIPRPHFEKYCRRYPHAGSQLMKKLSLLTKIPEINSGIEGGIVHG